MTGFRSPPTASPPLFDARKPSRPLSSFATPSPLSSTPLPLFAVILLHTLSIPRPYHHILAPITTLLPLPHTHSHCHCRPPPHLLFFTPVSLLTVTLLHTLSPSRPFRHRIPSLFTMPPPLPLHTYPLLLPSSTPSLSFTPVPPPSVIFHHARFLARPYPLSPLYFTASSFTHARNTTLCHLSPRPLSPTCVPSFTVMHHHASSPPRPVP